MKCEVQVCILPLLLFILHLEHILQETLTNFPHLDIKVNEIPLMTIWWIGLKNFENFFTKPGYKSRNELLDKDGNVL